MAMSAEDIVDALVAEKFYTRESVGNRIVVSVIPLGLLSLLFFFLIRMILLEPETSLTEILVPSLICIVMGTVLIVNQDIPHQLKTSYRELSKGIKRVDESGKTLSPLWQDIKSLAHPAKLIRFIFKVVFSIFAVLLILYWYMSPLMERSLWEIQSAAELIGLGIVHIAPPLAAIVYLKRSRTDWIEERRRAIEAYDRRITVIMETNPPTTGI